MGEKAAGGLWPPDVRLSVTARACVPVWWVAGKVRVHRRYMYLLAVVFSAAFIVGVLVAGKMGQQCPLRLTSAPGRPHYIPSCQ